MHASNTYFECVLFPVGENLVSKPPSPRKTRTGEPGTGPVAGGSGGGRGPPPHRVVAGEPTGESGLAHAKSHSPIRAHCRTGDLGVHSCVVHLLNGLSNQSCMLVCHRFQTVVIFWMCTVAIVGRQICKWRQSCVCFHSSVLSNARHFCTISSAIYTSLPYFNVVV